MALIWEKRQKGRHYRVTQAGASVRLYTNGVFHSQYNSRHPVAGNVWDLLLLPAFLHPSPDAIRRILVLGVGGGAVLRQCERFLRPDCIVGVDLDPVHLSIARRYFGVRGKHVQLQLAEARDWLSHHQGLPFDLIIEDIFSDSLSDGRPSEPVRAIAADEQWIRLLARHLSPSGVLVMNFESPRSVARSACKNLIGDSRPFAEGHRFVCPHYENAIAALLRKSVSPGHFAASLQRDPLLDQRRRSCRLQFSRRRI